MKFGGFRGILPLKGRDSLKKYLITTVILLLLIAGVVSMIVMRTEEGTPAAPAEYTPVSCGHEYWEEGACRNCGLHCVHRQWVDGMCIPKGSTNKECAEAFINFMCREDIATMNMDYICYSTPIQAVADSLETTDERAYAVMNPAQEVLDRCEFFHDISDTMDLYEQVWMEIRLVR